MELTEHYRTEMALRYLPIRYETMVTRQAETVRSTLDFIGAPFDRSLHRDQHYRRHLEPVIAILRPLIERLGYTAD